MASVIASSRRLTLGTLDTASHLVSTVHIAVNVLHNQAKVWHNDHAYDCAMHSERSRATALHRHVTEALQEMRELHQLLHPEVEFDVAATRANLIARFEAALDKAQIV
jgi:hypothetical protein